MQWTPTALSLPAVHCWTVTPRQPVQHYRSEAQHPNEAARSPREVDDSLDEAAHSPREADGSLDEAAHSPYEAVRSAREADDIVAETGHPPRGVTRKLGGLERKVSGVKLLSRSLRRLPLAADGGLELDADPAQQTTAQLRAYQQLVSTHTTSSFSLDAGCAPVRTDTQVPGSMAPGSAAGSRFFQVLAGMPAAPVNHTGYMSPAELRLLSEWIDIGAQYYNNPFAAPLNN